MKQHLPIRLPGFALALALAAGPVIGEDQASTERLKEGWSVFNRTCTVCHWPGVGGAPRIGR